MDTFDAGRILNYASVPVQLRVSRDGSGNCVEVFETSESPIVIQVKNEYLVRTTDLTVKYWHKIADGLFHAGEGYAVSFEPSEESRAVQRAPSTHPTVRALLTFLHGAE